MIVNLPTIAVLPGPVNEFLSHPFWQVPCRISYPVYLISLPVQKWIFYSTVRDIYLSNTTILLSYCGVLVISFMSAFFISLIAEAPYINITKVMEGRPLQTKKRSSSV
ncbi:uncharacterized protein LOC125177797 [Hyalella azteca]|uniref:Uncharacterized protein LOC125177797 n=1 Tax=Hyalella azteca TaxID=294128 RepID=A0A979FHI0_HYAAZ|nr:uncharacterized protein LOC125177797 [Hyalella azteca]